MMIKYVLLIVLKINSLVKANVTLSIHFFFFLNFLKVYLVSLYKTNVLLNKEMIYPVHRLIFNETLNLKKSFMLVKPGSFQISVL